MVPIDHFDEAAARFADRVAIINGDVSVTYAALVQLTHQVAVTLGPNEGDDAVPVGLYSPNDYRVIAAMLGIMRAGGAIVPLHARNGVDTNVRFMTQVCPRWLMYHSSLADSVRVMQSRVPSLAHEWCLDTEIEAGTTGPAYDASWIDATGNSTRPVYYWQTSGTTGEPKVVVNDCGGFDATHKLMRPLFERRGAGATHVSLVAAPLSHSAGPYAFTMLTLGATLVILPTFDPVAVLRAIERHRVTHLWIPPTALYMLLVHPETRRTDLSSLRDLQLGAAAVSPDKLAEALEIFGPCISQSYGQIETGPLTFLDGPAIAAALHTQPHRLRSSGQALGMNRIGCMSDDGRLLPPGQEGEIVARGRCVKPYLDPAATEEARRYGWHHTGDLGYMDDDGFLYVTGRVKDVVITSGFKIAAAEVERVIMEMPEVLECAVVGIPDLMRGEVAKAVLVARPGEQVSVPSVLSHCRARLGSSKTPTSVEFWPELPKSAVGKIDKRRIREICSAAPTARRRP